MGDMNAAAMEEKGKREGTWPNPPLTPPAPTTYPDAVVAGARAMREILMNCLSVPSSSPESLDFDVIDWAAAPAAVVFTGSHDDCQRWIEQRAFAAGLEAMWQPIETAPKSLANGSHIQGVYLLGYCPEEGADPLGCLEVIWWEPLTKSERGAMGCWFGGACFEVHPTHWQPLPHPPRTTGDAT